MPTDDELIEEILNGSQAAMEVLVRRHYKEIFSYVYRKIGDYHISYDLTQEIFIKMMKNIRSYRLNNQFSHWLLKIAVNHCRDYYRSSNFKSTNAMELNESFTDANNKVWDIFKAKHQYDDVKDAILSLPEEQREVIILRFYHDMKIKEIANITRCKEPTVKSRLRQALLKLKKLLKKTETETMGGEIHEKRQNKSV